MLPKITWLLNCVGKYSLWSESSAFSEKLHRQVPEDAKIFFPKGLYSLKQPRKSAIKQCSTSALPGIFSMYGILELDQSSRNYLQKADLEKHIQITAYYLIAKLFI